MKKIQRKQQSNILNKPRLNRGKPILKTCLPTGRTGTKTYEEVVKAIKVMKEEFEKTNAIASMKDDIRIL
jgi:hypothetical protein